MHTRRTSLLDRRATDQVGGYVSLDSAGRVLNCNPAFLRLLGLDSEGQARGLDFWALASDPESREKVDLLIREQGRAEGLEITLRGADEVPVLLLTNIIGKLDAEGSIERLDLQFTDISERRKREQQWGRVQRMESLGRLACGVAHDFNNLLTAILGYADVLEESLDEDAPQQREIQQIRMAGEKGAGLTRQLLTFARGKVTEPTTVDLNRVVREMRPLLIQLVGRRIDLELDLAADLKPTRLNKPQLEQVILNLVTNARDAMQGSGALRLRTLNHRVEQSFVLHHDVVLPGQYVMLAVRDTGIGIEPEIMDHLFEPFFTTKQEGEGTGLGLATVYGTVRQHNGFISVYNEPQGGVTFKVSFPGLDQEQPTRAVSPRPAAARDLDARTILLAEDDADVRRLIEGEIRALGFTVLSARDGQEALELAVKHSKGIRLLLSDVSMPQLDGVELARRFCELHPSVPIILFSGSAKQGLMIPEAAAPVGFLEKPFTVTQLRNKIRAVL